MCFNKQSDEDENHAKETWTYILRDHSRGDVDQHIGIVATFGKSCAPSRRMRLNR